MNINNWFIRLKKQKEQKKIEKLKSEFSFFVDAINVGNKQIVDEMQQYEKELIDARAKELEENIINNLLELRNIQSEEKNEIINILVELMTKIENISGVIIGNSNRIISAVDDKVTLFHSEIEEIQEKCISLYDEVQRGCTMLVKTINFGNKQIVDEMQQYETAIFNTKAEEIKETLINLLEIMRVQAEGDTEKFINHLVEVKNSQFESKNEIKNTLVRVMKKIEDIDDDITENSNKIISAVDEMQQYETNIISTRARELQEKIINPLESIRKQSEEDKEKIINHLLEVKNSQSENKNEIKNTFFEIMKRIGDIDRAIIGSSDRIISVVNDKFSLLYKEIEEAQEEYGVTYDEVNKILQSILRQMDIMHKDTKDSFETEKLTFEDRTNNIMLNIDEVKTLMKIIAVNNLLDEI